MRIDEQAILSFDRSRLVLGILAGFAVSASVTLATRQDDKRKRVSLILELTLMAACFLIAATCIAWGLADMAAFFQSRSINAFPDEAKLVIILFYGTAYIGMGALTLALSCLGFLRSWSLGFSSLLTALAALVLIFVTSNAFTQMAVPYLR